ncbi:hypothetical protein M8C21_002818 [Ambrosia artemisiifolia]|uniref:Golgi apparatus membrane protein TVP15 n=1 Tax=Ambrosia artemisiifolia TaxID=4212 RepID=A0AAD5BT24_AMBAR|nr:hypothetical protein M8C21_002818 [Ambrosia artemisiifolia]
MSRDIEEADVTQPLANTTATTSSSTNPKPKPKSDPILATCRCFSFVTIVASILCIIANVYSAVRSFTDGLDIFDGIFRCYAVVIAVFVIVAETEWSFVTKFWKVLEYWAGRGMLQIFVAVMTRAYSDTYTERHAILLLQDIASYTMLACGLIYVVSGVLCLGFLKRARQNKQISAQQAIKDLQELEQRRAELEALLIDDTP